MTNHSEPYANIRTETHYRLLLASGMFWEIYPELTGDWSKDKLIINAEDEHKHPNKEGHPKGQD